MFVFRAPDFAVGTVWDRVSASMKIVPYQRGIMNILHKCCVGSFSIGECVKLTDILRVLLLYSLLKGVVGNSRYIPSDD